MKTVHILGIPMDLGQHRRGVDMGPSAIRYAELQREIELRGLAVIDHGNEHVPNPEESEATVGDNRLHAVGKVCEAVCAWGQHILATHGPEDVLLFLGGDHSMSIGSVKAVASEPEKLGVVWIDAHADFNTPASSPSGNIHGMPLAVLTGEGAPSLVNIGGGVRVPFENVVLVGVRDVDSLEAERVREKKLGVYTMSALDSLGMAQVATSTLERLAHCERLHVSLDLDSLDPSQAPGVGTPVKGGLSYREAHLLCEILGDSRRVRSIDLVEVNPILDERNVTAELAVDLVTSLFGKKIL